MGLPVLEGGVATAGQRIAIVRNDKIGSRISVLDTPLKALQAPLDSAEAEFARGEALGGQGSVTRQHIPHLRTQAEVTRNQIAATAARRPVVVEQDAEAEGAILAPSPQRQMLTAAAGSRVQAVAARAVAASERLVSCTKREREAKRGVRSARSNDS